MIEHVVVLILLSCCACTYWSRLKISKVAKELDQFNRKERAILINRIRELGKRKGYKIVPAKRVSKWDKL